MNDEHLKYDKAIARLHFGFWPLFTIGNWVFLYFLMSAILGTLPPSANILGLSISSLIGFALTGWGNFTGFKAMLSCEKNKINYRLF
jgi:hypothetical protein